LESYDLKVEQKEAHMIEVTINLNAQKRRVQDLVDVMDQFTIYAPKSGMVIYHKEWGGSKRKVGSEFNTWDPTVATLPDMSAMISKTFVNEIDISKVKVDQPVRIGVDAFPDKKFNGKVIEVANVGEDLPGSDAKVFEVVIRVEGSDTVLRPNMTSSNVILAKHFDKVLSIPLEAIHNNDSLTYVFAENSDPVKQIIEVGESNENSIIILDGLEKDDIVYLTIPKNADDLDYKGLEIYERLKAKRVKEKKKAREERKLREQEEKEMKAKQKMMNGGTFKKGDMQKMMKGKGKGKGKRKK
ncbi:MAG: efflux RND transporter periplasmic adaptor subunit, partial [Bacteroidota bacterium]|nr:efflux RND transporter periplasmic adaptor subunit [Bacteroidota bacterium]